jgi:predicted nucleotidyltransferase
MNSDLEEIKRKIRPLLISAGISKSAIFGSYVRGENTEKSDIDILIEVPKGMSLFDMGGLQMELTEILGKKVDLVNYKTIKPRLKSYILNEKVQIL